MDPSHESSFFCGLFLYNNMSRRASQVSSSASCYGGFIIKKKV